MSNLKMGLASHFFVTKGYGRVVTKPDTELTKNWKSCVFLGQYMRIKPLKVTKEPSELDAQNPYFSNVPAELLDLRTETSINAAR